MKSLMLTPFVLHTRPRSSRALYLARSSSQERLLAPEPVRASVEDHQPLVPLDQSLSRDLSSLNVLDPEAARDRNLARYTEILGCIEDLIIDHILHERSGNPGLSRLTHLVPSIGKFFTPLPLKETFLKINTRQGIAARRFVPPSFNDIRNLLNLSQVKSISKIAKLITFDGDMTLYADGKDFSRDSHLVELLIGLLEKKLYVAIVTAAGYPGDASRYEQRLSGLLDGFKASKLPKECLERFFVLGGECNYLFRYDPSTHHLLYIHPEEYQSANVKLWSQAGDEVSKFLDVAESNLTEVAKEMGIHERVRIIRKQLAVGVIPAPGNELSREILDEFALSTQRQLRNYQETLLAASSKAPRIPFCAFNGGSDVWVDIGNKLIGVQILQEFIKANGHETLHVGDQFLSTGNDIATRSASCTIWITSPKETGEILHELISMMDEN